MMRTATPTLAAVPLLLADQAHQLHESDAMGEIRALPCPRQGRVRLSIPSRDAAGTAATLENRD
jgi:hypothetical protein